MKKKARNILITLSAVALLSFLLLKLSFSPKSFENYQFLSDLKQKMIKEDWLKTDDYQLLKIEKDEGKFKGFDWLNEQGEVELLKGYYFNYDPFNQRYTQPDENIPLAAKKTKDYLVKKGFQVNTKNSFYENEESFWAQKEASPGRLALEKGEVKCLLESGFLGLAESGFNLICNRLEIGATPPVYQELYQFVNPDGDLSLKLSLDKQVANFAVGGVGDSYGGAATLWKKEAGQWQVSQVTQMAWDCQKLLDDQVPPELIPSCLFYDQPDQDFLDYPQLYRQTFGQ